MNLRICFYIFSKKFPSKIKVHQSIVCVQPYIFRYICLGIHLRLSMFKFSRNLSIYKSFLNQKLQIISSLKYKVFIDLDSWLVHTMYMTCFCDFHIFNNILGITFLNYSWSIFYYKKFHCYLWKGHTILVKALQCNKIGQFYYFYS